MADFTQPSAFTFNHADQVDIPDISANDMKVYLDSRAKELRDYLIAFLAEIKAVADGASGADKIGATAIAGFSGTTLQAILEAYKTAIDLNTAKVTNATHSSDVTGDTALIIANKAVTLAKMNDMATASLIYRKTAGAGVPEVNTLATLKTDLNLPAKASGAEADTGTDDAKFLTAKAAKDSHNIPSVAPSTSGNVLVSNGTDWTSTAKVGTETGSYDGNDAYGSGTPNTFVFSSAPKLVVIKGAGEYTGFFPMLSLTTTLANMGYTYFAASGLNVGYAKKSADGLTLTWYHTASAQNQLNRSGFTYSVLGIL